MATPIPHDYRLKIIRDRQAGQTWNTIAQQTGYSVSGVKKIWRRYQADGQAGLALRYHRCGRKSPFDVQVRQHLISLKDGEQGAPYVRSVLAHQHPDWHLPHERTIQRWWKGPVESKPKVKRRSCGPDWTEEVHHTWQVDGKEEVSLANDDLVSWINVADEASSSALSTLVFPPTGDAQNSSQPGGSALESGLSKLGLTQTLED